MRGDGGRDFEAPLVLRSLGEGLAGFDHRLVGRIPLLNEAGLVARTLLSETRGGVLLSRGLRPASFDVEVAALLVDRREGDALAPVELLRLLGREAGRERDVERP